MLGRALRDDVAAWQMRYAGNIDGLLRAAAWHTNQPGQETHRPLLVRSHPLPTARPADVHPLLPLRGLPATDWERFCAQRDHRDSGDQTNPRHAGGRVGASVGARLDTDLGRSECALCSTND